MFARLNAKKESSDDCHTIEKAKKLKEPKNSLQTPFLSSFSINAPSVRI
jgi:hypothetical protein